MSDSPLCPYCQSNLLPVWCAIESGVLCSRSEQIAAWLLDSSTLADRKQMFRDRRLEETTTPEERTVYCPVGRERRPGEGLLCSNAELWPSSRQATIPSSPVNSFPRMSHVNQTG
jgi:hypothetical protein